MFTVTLDDGKVVSRVFAGFVYSPTDVERMKREVLAELKSARGTPLLVELWQYAEPGKQTKKGQVRTNLPELSHG